MHIEDRVARVLRNKTFISIHGTLCRKYSHLSGCTFSSLSPTSAFVDGVKIGGSSLADSLGPGGNLMPCTVPFCRYSL